MILVLKWIFHDLLGENGSEAFRQTAKFVVRLNRSGDTVVIPFEKRWREKANRLREAANSMHREAGRLFVNLFWDSSRGIILLPENIPATSQNLYDWAPSKDVYLIEAFVASEADLLVTTDETLFDALTERGAVECMMRTDFLSRYAPTRSSS